MNPKVDQYLKRAKKWREEMTMLREIILESPLAEELKWGKPCYAFNGANVVLIVGFKNYCSLLFAKGALLKDPKGVLIRPTENTQAARQLRFTSVQEVIELRRVVKALVAEGIRVEKAGLEVAYKKVSEFNVPEELQSQFAKMPKLKKVFEALTPGRQKAYLLYFSGAKQSITRAARVEKSMPRILKGKGLDD